MDTSIKKKMALYRIDVGDGTDTNTVVADVGWRFSINLNQVNEAELKFSGTGEARRSLLGIGSTVYIYKNGVIAFKGLIDNTDYFVGGTVVFHASGWEVRMAKEPGAYAGSPWTSTASASIFSAIIAESSYISAGTIEAGYSMDYRLTASQTLWNGMSNLANKTSQDVSMDYTADPVEMSILSHAGSSSSVAVLNEGKEITNLRKSQGYPRGNSIIVKGKGDGANQISATASDATSIATYGVVTKTIVDPSIMTTAEATRLAAAALAINKDPPNIYDFDLTNPDYTSLVVGDHITLNALDQDVANTEVRIVGIEEGQIGGKAFVSLQVTNPGLKRLMRTKNKIMAQLKKDQDDSQTYMQGNTVTNEFGTGINADSSHGAKVGFYVPPEFDTEAGSLDVVWMNADFDVDPYNSQFGSASYTGSDPQVQNSSGNTGPDVENSSASTAPGVSGTSASTTLPAISGTIAYATNTDSSYSPFPGNHARVYMYDDVIGSPTFELGRAYIMVFNDSGGSVSVNPSYTTSGGASGTTGNYTLSNGSYYSGEGGTGTESSWENDYLRVFDTNSNATWWWGGAILVYSHTHGGHTHGDGSYAAASHPHADGSYAAASHSHPDGSYDVNSADLDHISIGDSVSEAGSVNATGVTITLDYWNGSAWVNKHTVVFSSSTLETNVDMTDSGTYPDQDGYWRMTFTTNSASADFVNAKVRTKYKIDN